MKKKIIYDVFLSIVSSFIPVIGLQFILLPILASQLNNDLYGKILTIVALMNLSAATLGNILNNSRLIFNSRYKAENIKGDYNILLVFFLCVNLLIVFLGLQYFDKPFSLISFILISLSTFSLLIKGYAVVEFRIKLDYVKIFYESLFLFGGYFIGFLLFLIFNYWQLIYLCGYTSSLIYVFKNTNILREPLRKTQLFKFTSLQTYSLLFSGLLLSLGTYLDKLLLFPLLGGEIVAIYYAASIIGKTVALVIQPITGVFLSYLAPLDKFSNRNFSKILSISFITGTISYLIVVLISKPILLLIYPQYAIESVNYIPIITLSTIILVICNIINAILLKFIDLKWQIAINSFYLLVYVLMSLLLIRTNGLMGFCTGILIASIFKLIAMIIIYFVNNRSNKIILT